MNRLSPDEYMREVVKTESNRFDEIGARMSRVKYIRLLHAAMGISTELTELFEALDKNQLDRVNFAEECGDIYYYIGLVCDEQELVIEDLFVEADQLSRHRNEYFLTKLRSKLIPKIMLKELTVLTTIHSGNILDIMKKTIFYGDQKFSSEKIESELVQIIAALNQMLAILGYEVERVLAINIEKLQMKRYKNKSFSSQEAINRDLVSERDSLEKIKD